MDCSLPGPLSMGSSRQEHWSALPCPPPRDLHNPGIKPGSSALQADSLLLSHQERPQCRTRFNSWVEKIPWRREWQPTPIFLPGEFQGQRSLVGYSPQGCKESDTTEWLNMHALTEKTLWTGRILPNVIEQVVWTWYFNWSIFFPLYNFTSQSNTNSCIRITLCVH